MADFADATHRPHAIHTGEEPRNPITYGPESLSVTLDRWGPVDSLFTSMYDALQANWGEEPSRTIYRTCDGSCQSLSQHRTGWCSLEPHERSYVESCFAGRTLQQVLEGITFDFCIDGVSRAFTHQNVRTRLGAGFMQHGGRDNDWRHRPWTMPETMRRMCEAWEHVIQPVTTAKVGDAKVYLESGNVDNGLKHCISNWDAIRNYLILNRANDSIRDEIEQHIQNGRQLYAALVDAGIPWQDARRVLFMGMQTYIHDQYNYLALSGVLANRLEHIMDWEFNCVAQLMLREVKMKCPPLLSKYLGSHSDKAKAAKFAGLESWPPDGKYPSPFERCKTCQHAAGNHFEHPDTNDVHICEACERGGGGDIKISEPITGFKSITIDGGGGSIHRYEGIDTLPRQHRPEQMPFFVLHPDSMAGGPIVWIPTNGTYPHQEAPL